MIEIKDISGQVRFSTLLNKGAKGKFTLMKEDYIVLPFSVPKPIPFRLGDYVDLAGILDESLGGKLAKIYEIVDPQKPTYNQSTGGYDYQLRMDAYYWKWKNKIFKYTPEQAGSEASWSLTATLDVQLGVFLRNLKALGYTYRGTDFIFSIDDTVENKAVAMTYDNMNLLDALFSMAGEDKWNCDCWITDNVIHFGRNEFGDAVKIERGVEASAITRSESQGTYATRIYAFGSTRNIPTNYRPTDEQAVINGIVQKRLMLPADTPYIDSYPDMTTEEAIEDVVVFDDVYPRRVGTLSDVQTVDRKVENPGEGEAETFKAYQYKDTGLLFKDEYILEGQEIEITFQSGKLNGMQFGVIFDPENKDEQLWEIVRNENYGRPLPDDTIRPENGDQYILSGFDIQLVSDQYIPAAEQELKEKAQAYADKAVKDDGTYSATLRSTWVYADQIARTFEFGQRINLVDDAYFDSGRISRVLGWELNLDIPYDSPVYTIGESMPYSRIGEIEDRVDALTYKGQTYTGGGGGVYVIRTNDSTAPSDSNVFSALRSLRQFTRKDVDDTVRGLLTMLKGIQSDDYNSGLLGAGFALRKGSDGKSFAEVDRLTVRWRAIFNELQIKQTTYVGGDAVFSPASMRCISVEKEPEKYRCFFKADDGDRAIRNLFAVNDLAICRQFNLKETGGATEAGRYYWRRVVAVGADYIDLSVNDCMSGSDEPQAGDDIVTVGNTADATRQNAIIISSYGEDAPSLKLYRNIDSFSLSGKDEIVISPSGNKFKGDFYLATGESLSESVADAVNSAYWAEQIAQAAADAAANASSEAEAAKERLNQWAADGVISPSEKQGLKDEKVRIEADRKDIDNSYGKYSVSYSLTQYYSYQEKYKADLDKLSASYPEVIPIPDYFANDQYNYYAERTAVLNAIAAAAKEYAEYARTTSEKALEDAAAAQEAAALAKAEAEAAADRLEQWAEDGVISPTEKLAIKDEIVRIDADKQEIADGYGRYELGTPAEYNVAHSAYRTGLVVLSKPEPENIPIPTDFSGKQEAYYTQRTAALNAIAAAAKSYTETITGSLRSEFSGQFTVLATKIDSKVSQTDYDSNNKQIQQQISEIQQTADNISLTVTKSTSAINYLINSGDFVDSSHWGFIGMKGVYSVISKTIGGVISNVLKFNITEHTYVWGHLMADFRPDTFGDDETYTLSIKAVTKVFKGIRVGFRDSQGNVYYDKTFPYSAAGVYTYTFDYKSAKHTTSNTKLTRFCVFPYPDALQTTAVSVEIYWIMLQKGKVATPWQPSSVDLEDALVTTGIDIKHREINLQADKVFFKSNDGDETVRIFTEDGKIEAERIDTDTLAAKRVIATSAIGAVLIENGKMQMSDRNGKLKLIVSGNNLSTSSSDRNVTLQSKTVTLPETNNSIITVGKTVLCSFSTNNGAYVTIPPMRVTMNMTSINDYVTDGRLLCHYRLYLDGTELKSEQRVATGTAQNLSFTSDEIKVDPRSLNAGTHEIYITLQFKAESGDLSNPRKIDSAGWTFKPSVSTNNLIAISYPTDYTEIAANGFRASAGLNKYIMQTADKAELRFGNYILRLDANGIRASNNGGTSWQNVVAQTTFTEE